MSTAPVAASADPPETPSPTAAPADPKQKPEKISFAALYRYASRKDLALLALGSTCAAACGLSIPLLNLFFGGMIDAVISYPADKDAAKLTTEVNRVSLILTCIGLGGWLMAYLQVSCFMLSGENQAKRMRLLYVKSLFRQDVGWYDGQETGDLTSRLTSDISVIQEGISDKVGVVIMNFVTFFGSYVVALVQGWKMTLVVTAALPALAAVGGLASVLLAKSTASGQEAYGSAGAIAQQAFAAIRTVVAFGGEEREAQRYTKKLELAKKAGYRKAFMSGFSFSVLDGLIYLLYALAYWYGGTRIAAGEMTPGQVFNVFLALFLGTLSLSQSQPGFLAMSSARGAAVNVFKTIERKSKIDALSDEGKTLPHVDGVVEFKGVTFAYPQRQDVTVLENFNLKIEAGNTVALVGGSGSGKSTAVKLLERFYDPSAGTVTVDGVDIRDLNLRWLRTQLGIVSQEPVLFDTTVRQNILYGYEDAGKSHTDAELDALVENACKVANAWQFVQRLPKGIYTQVGEAGGTLSGGQKQRIAIARAVIRNPRILLLDEATSALDVESERVVQAALDSAAEGRTTLVVAHRLSTVKTADVIVVMKDGKILETGNHLSLVEKGGYYASLVQNQQMDVLERKHTAQSGETIQPQPQPVSEKRVRGSELVLDVENGQKNPATMTAADASEKIATEEQLLQQKAKQEPLPLLRVLGLNSPEWYLYLLGGIGALVSGVMAPLFNVVFVKLLETLRETGDELMDGVNFFAVVFVVIGIVAVLASFAQISSFGISGEILTYRLRDMTFRALLRQEIGYFDDPLHSSGALADKLASDASNVQNLAGQFLGNILKLIVSTAAALGVAFYFQWEVALITLASIPLTGLAGWSEIRVLNVYGAKKRDAFALAAKSVTDALSNIKTVASLTKEEMFFEAYKECIEVPHKASVRIAFLAPIGYGFGQGVINFSFALAFFYGSTVIVSGRAAAGDVLQSIFGVLMGAIAVAQGVQFLPNLSKAKLGAISIFEILDRSSRIDASVVEGDTKEHVDGRVDGKDISFAYPTRPLDQILKNFAIVAEPGQTVAIVGPSGSGKSTIIALLERFYDIAGGSLEMEGLEVSKWKLPVLREKMALVSQEPVLFNTSIRENIMYGAIGGTATDDEIIAAAKVANAHDFISGLPQGYATVVGDKGGQLSGGQKQRVAIARSMIRKPRLLLLDEATSALDSESEKIVQAALDAAAQGRTTVVIAHRLSTIQNASRILVVQAGSVIESGTHEELVRLGGMYSEMVSQQSLK